MRSLKFNAQTGPLIYRIYIDEVSKKKEKKKNNNKNKKKNMKKNKKKQFFTEACP